MGEVAVFEEDDFTVLGYGVDDRLEFGGWRTVGEISLSFWYFG